MPESKPLDTPQDPSMEIEVKKSDLQSEIGATGTFLVHGYLSMQDYNADMTGISGIRNYDKMRKSDATVRISIMALVLPIISGHWFMEPASEDAKDKEIADFITYAVLSGKTLFSWDQFTEEALKLCLSYGRIAFEKVFGIVDFNGQPLIGFRKVPSRQPQTVYRWAIGEGENEKAGITQWIPAGNIVEIPWEKLVVFVNEKEGDNWEGISLLRTSYKNWHIKSQLEKIDSIAHERQGLGIPFAQARPGFTPTDKERALVQTALRNLRANENAFVEIPAGYEIGWMDMKAGTTRTPYESIEYHDRQIMKNVLLQFLEIGGKKGSSGSFAASDNQMDLLILALQSIAQNFMAVVQQGMVKQLVDLNWPDYGVYPTLKVDKIGPDNAGKLSDILLKLTQAHIITPTDEDEEFMRNIMEMPELPEDMEGTIDRSFQPLMTANTGDGADASTEPTPTGNKKKAPEGVGKTAKKADPEAEVEKKAQEMLITEVKSLREEVLKALYGDK